MTWTNFTREEFACQHCGKNEIQDRFIDVLQEIRDGFGASMRISSGYRCPDHPIEARKAKPGAHATGLAADVSVTHGEAFRLLLAVMGHPSVTGLGINQKGSGRFIHIDIAPPGEGRPRPHLWSY